ncbi:MAG: DNA-processing protein DprA [Clostridiales bacterium]|nr:DNA-processing protein DprA [Clostridiales bacterium]
MYSLAEKICILFGNSGVSNAKFVQLWNSFDSVENLVGNFSDSSIARQILGDNYSGVNAALKRKAYDELIADMDKHKVFAVTCFSDAFPESLRNIDDMPYVLFCRGNAKLLSTDSLGVVGTRKITSYGKRVTRDFVTVLSEYFTIVSGLAYGVDAVAHETTLNEGGNTIAVLGGGLINVYPSANQGLADRILLSGGLLISEYGMNAVPLAYRFPHRNRLVSGLSKGLLVCQAAAKSGTNSTVECALQQGRDVFVVPGEIYDQGYIGSNRLIKSMQGACVTTPRDIVDYYGLDRIDAQKATYQISIEEQQVVSALSLGQLTFDQLVQETGIPPANLNFLLANLELRSIIAKLPGNCYRLYGGIE